MITCSNMPTVPIKEIDFNDIANNDRARLLQIDALLALSRLFSKGGEFLTETLPPLAQAFSALIDYNRVTNHPNHLPDCFNPEWESALTCVQDYSGRERAEFEQMGFEFNRLFVGPAAPVAPPYESVYLSPDRLVMQEQTLNVRRFYAEANLRTLNQGKDPDDFLATELEFIAYLLTRAIMEESAGHYDQASLYKELYVSFWAEHLNRWLPPFAGLIEKNSRHPVFPAIAGLILNFYSYPMENQI